MKIPRLLIFASAGLAVVLVLIWGGSAYWERKQAVFQNAPKLITALQTFLRDAAAHGRHLPSEISLQDLVAGSYLTTNDVAAFQGMEVRFVTRYDPSLPQSIIARARTQGGEVICLLGDGSVQQFSPQRINELNPGQSNLSNLFRSETN
jgi:hypothetical protein